MVNKVVFFNFYHNGDLHVSRGLVREVAKRCNEKGILCEYFHNNSPFTIGDIPNISFTRHSYHFTNTTTSHVQDNTLFLNTWYGGNQDIFNSLGLTFDTLYKSFQEAVQPLEIGFNDIDPISMFPSIDFTKYYTDSAQRWLANNHRRRIFISNGLTLSGQFPNFPFANIINRLSNEHPEIDFLISNEENGFYIKSNIIFTKDIIKKTELDLNENSYLASHCDTIIGRFSGTYTFAMTKENYFDNPKKFIVFTIPSVDKCVWTYNYTPVPTAQILNYNCCEEHAIYDVLKQNI